MTLPRSETPLRRSAVGSHRESMLRDLTTMVNDDEAERREARRRTLLQQTRPRESSALESIEENETIRKCLEIYNGNKLCRDNAWSLSLIDTLSSLLDRHHKTLSNFKVNVFRMFLEIHQLPVILFLVGWLIFGGIFKGLWIARGFHILGCNAHVGRTQCAYAD